MACCHLFNTAVGVFAGAAKPVHAWNSYPGTPVSAIVGMSGIEGTRRESVSASARNRPAFTGTSAAEGVVVDAKGNVFGAEVGPRRVSKYTKK